MLRLKYIIFLFFLAIFSTLLGQNSVNCFLVDFELKEAEIPVSIDALKTSDSSTVLVSVNSDTLGKISKYVFGNAIAAWAGAHDNPLFVDGVKLLSPSLIRMPGGSWSNGYFWNGIPQDVPDSIYDGTTYNSTTGKANKGQFYGQSGANGSITTPDQYYALREKTEVTEGLITVNYAYARYGTSDDPVAKAAHLAADWVRYDNGRTRFWEIGNENGGPWEYGWMIDTALNKDGQPQIINGALYGKHFRVFADSMRAAASEIGTTIYIGGQVVIYGETSWNSVDKNWNEGFFTEAGDSPDFYVVHTYFGTNYTPKYLLNVAVSEPKKQLDDLKKSINKYNGYMKPVALTEYNMGLGATAEQQTSYINGMQAVLLMSELIKNNYGLGARWLLLSWIEQMFYSGPDTEYLYHPRPDFYYLHYLPKFYGDHSISTSSSKSDIVCYASKFSSGETGVILVNKGSVDQVVSLNISGVGDKYYVYSFTGGTEDPDFSQNVYINGYAPDDKHWGPYNELVNIPANCYSVGDDIKVNSPERSIQMIMIEGGDNVVEVAENINSQLPKSFNLFQNYPNPFNPSTAIKYQIPYNDFVTLKIYDVLGKEIKTLVNEYQDAGIHTVEFNADSLNRSISSGAYIYTLEVRNYRATKKLLLLK